MPENKNLLEETVFPSEEKTIIVQGQGDGYGGAHNYRFIKSKGFENGKTIYCDSGNLLRDSVSIQFVQKTKDGHVFPGLLNEQLIIALKDRIKKLDAKFPHPENQNMLKALDDFLEASKRRIRERMDRGVMGELKE